MKRYIILGLLAASVSVAQALDPYSAAVGAETGIITYTLMQEAAAAKRLEPKKRAGLAQGQDCIWGQEKIASGESEYNTPEFKAQVAKCFAIQEQQAREERARQHAEQVAREEREARFAAEQRALVQRQREFNASGHVAGRGR